MRVMQIARFMVMGVALFVAGCTGGLAVRETLPPATPGAGVDQMERVVVLPLADQTPSPSAYAYAERGEMVERILYEEIYGLGFYPVPRDEMLFFLSGQGMVRLYGSVSPETEALQEELRWGGWSESMQTEIGQAIEKNRLFGGVDRPNEQDHGAARMDRDFLLTMGRAFDASYMIRGGVAFFGVRSEDSFDPRQIGFFPLLFKSGGRTLFGVADPETYEEEQSFFYVESRGRIPNATVYLWLKGQDASTGEVFWMNRVEVRSKRNSIFDVPEREEMFEASVRQAARSLLDDFLRGAADYRERQAAQTMAREEATQAKAAGGCDDVAAARRAAEEARRAALEASEAAKEAGESARKIQAVFDKIIAK